MGFNKFARYYLSSLLTKEVKHDMLSFFYRGNKEIVKDLKNYVEVKSNSHYQRAYTKDEDLRKLLNEVQNLKVGTIDFENVLSRECVYYLNECYKKKYYTEIDDAVSRNKLDSPMYDRYCNSRLDDIKNYCLTHFVDVAFDGNGLLSNDYLNKAFLKGFIPDYDKKNIQTISYALNENLFDMLEYDDDGKLKLVDWAYQKYVVNYEPLPLTTKEKLRKSLDNTYRTFIDYAKCNLSLFKYFVTLTFASKENEEIHIKNNDNRKFGEYDLKFKYVEDASSIEVCSKVLNTFFTNLKKQLKNKNYNLFYLGVPEFHKNGNIHYHFLFSDIPSDLLYKVPIWLDKDYYNGNINNGLGLKSWKYGKSDVELIVDKSRITTYISKYMIKSFDEISDTIYLERLNKQRYYKSNNLIKPKLLNEEEYDLIKEEVENSYISYYEYVSHNPYTDNTTIKKVYQLNDI